MTHGNQGNTTANRGRGKRSRLTKGEATALRTIFVGMGYTDARLPDGLVLDALIVGVQALLRGEIAAVLMADEERRAAINELFRHAAALEDIALAAALRDLAEQLARAAQREDEDDEEDAIIAK